MEWSLDRDALPAASASPSRSLISRPTRWKHLDGSRTDYLRYNDEILERGLEKDVADYR